MSKIQLKKELAKLDRDQLVQLILDLYNARKEAKSYFDFFVNPDVDALYEKYQKAIEKELGRSKYTKCTARISRIRAAIKEFASFDPGAEYVVNMMVYAIKGAILVEMRRIISQTFFSGVRKLCVDTLAYADKQAVFSHANKLLGIALNGEVGYRPFVNALRNSVDWPALPPKD